MGQLCLGKLLELGSKGDLVFDYVVYLRSILTCSIHP